MTTANLTSPMNPEILNDTVSGIDALAPAALRPAPLPALLGDAAGGRPPGT
ncbi:hypothetical protein OWM54_18970 [Myxococcus sp. MISCRS1]|jgi:hypothetical protein|uniref:Uncharacterized protein n=1 Tax=Myxococcus fulvus TaxID=33 RepID=A0A511T0L6_MYXFU|nr:MULTISPECIES: hypothetical protein [Myxococcus]BDT30776.1 hypothetical protein MFMH1_04450 [Myxococcus sp. MH1]MBZ4395428.1 hypothetical protein [Myxococcus sp. AS-1-15]MBZ4413820.1 hypothetical protein [Myxococcus sp. XM-1-1-1]MCK8499263.1 hypothetical protein [Myxococcus fulvus]MCP3063004.1 hypothetical protein [Myxococcus guangdongensis]